MVRPTVLAIVMLDFILIMMTAVWILVSIYRGLSNLELWYNYTYVVINLITLILNLTIITER